MYWAEALANQTQDAELKAQFENVAKDLVNNESKIVAELNDIQGDAVEIGGYYLPTESLLSNAMRPSETLNNILGQLN